MKKKIVAVMLTATMAASLLAGCGSSGSGSESSNSSNSNSSSESSSTTTEAGTGTEATEAAPMGHTLSIAAWDPNFNIPAIKAAEADYKANVDPEFTLNIVEQSGSTDLETAVTLAGSSGDYSALTDVILFQDHYFQKYATDYPDAFLPIDDAGMNWSDFGEEKCSFTTLNGVHYGYPLDNGTVIFAYRTDLLEEAGHSIDEMKGISWADFIKVGEDVYNKTGKYLLCMDGSGNDLIYMMLQAEGQSQFKDGKPVVAENETVAEIMTILEEMLDKNVLYLANDWSGYTDQAIVGDMVAGVMNGNWIIPTIRQVKENAGKWSITTLPTLKGGEGYASNGGSSFLITANCQDVALAKSFLTYTFGGSKTTYDAALKDGGVITSCISAGQSDVYNEPDEYFNGEAIYAKIVEMGSHVPVIEQSDYHYTLRNQMSSALINIHNGQDQKEALQAAQDQVNFEMGN